MRRRVAMMPGWALWWREVKTPRRCLAGMTGLATPVVMSHRMWQPSKGRALNWRPEDSCMAAISGQLSWDSAMAVHCKNANRFPGFPWNLSFLILQNTHLLLAENFAHSPFWILSDSSSKKCSATRRGTKFRAEEWNPPPPESNPGNILEI